VTAASTVPAAAALALTDVPGYLLDLGLIERRSIVDGDLVVRDVSSRNGAFTVERERGDSYLLKQADEAFAAAGRNEGRIYRALAAEGRMRAHLPRLHRDDGAGRVLVLEFLRDAEDLTAYHRRRRRRPPVRVAAGVGAILAELHSLGVSGSSPRLARSVPPSAVFLHRPGMGFLREASRGALEFVRILQAGDGMAEELERLGAQWSATAFIHNDVRWANLMVTPPGSRSGRPRLALIDWELAGLGDPCWDIGSALGAYLSMWLTSVPVTGTAPPAQSLRLASCPLDRVQPAIRACWGAYVARRGLDAGAADRLLPGAVAFAAVRLVQTAFEAAQMSADVASDSVLHLQVALNMLRRPWEAAAHLLGIPPGRVTGGGGAGGAGQAAAGAGP
jgi:thiamine kinase-like enzyme